MPNAQRNIVKRILCPFHYEYMNTLYKWGQDIDCPVCNKRIYINSNGILETHFIQFTIPVPEHKDEIIFPLSTYKTVHKGTIIEHKILDNMTKAMQKVHQEKLNKFSNVRKEEPNLEPFDFYKMTPSVRHTVARTRTLYAILRKHILEHTPNSRERSICLTELETSELWMEKAMIMHNEKERAEK